MWIKQLRIENFQSHKETVINFHPNFNCIVGTGNSGKSSIVRALSLILFGQWEGSWVRNGAEFCRITLTMNNDVVVIREKGKTMNRYRVQEPGKTEQIYADFGLKVPEEVEHLLHIFKAQIGDKEALNLNLSSQLDGLFLLSNPGAYKAKVFGTLSKAHYLDYVLKDISKDKRALSSEKTVLEKGIKTLESEIKAFEGLDEKKKQLDLIGQRLTQLEATQQRLDKLKDLFDRVTAWKRDYTIIKQKHQDLQNVTVTNTESLSAKHEVLKKVRSLFDKIKRFKVVYENTKTSLEETEKSKVLLSEKYMSVLKQNQKCPTCFGEIDEHTCEKILESLNA